MQLLASCKKSGIFSIVWTLVIVGIGILSIFALNQYRGESYIYILFTLASTTLLYFGFRKNAIFFDTFIGVFLWLGFWLKLTVRVAFMEGKFHESVGNFDGTGVAFDTALLVASSAFLGLLVASFIREKLLFTYLSKIHGVTQPGLSEFYKRYRTLILTGFVVLFCAVAASNLYFGFYQRGMVTRTVLPYGLNGIYKWLVLFGLASFSALVLRFEYSEAKKTLYLVAIISLMEGFLSNVSLLSRGMILNTSALVYGVYKGLRLYDIKSSFRFATICFVIFVVLFGSSVITVNYVRAVTYSDSSSDSLAIVKNSTKVLFLDRWNGIEGVMAVSSYPGLGWNLWKKAWQEEYAENRNSFYDTNLIDTPYKNIDLNRHHFVSLPGMVAFVFYPGSYLFLFFGMVAIGLIAALIEILTFRLGGRNVILCALIAQVVAYRFTSFGYVPSQSYLLFGSILLTIAMIYIAEKLLDYYFRRK